MVNPVRSARPHVVAVEADEGDLADDRIMAATMTNDQRRKKRAVAHWFPLVLVGPSPALAGTERAHHNAFVFGFAVFGIDLARTTSLRLRTP